MKIKTYVINLLRSSDRREYIRKETAKYPFLDVEWVEGVDGKFLTEEEVESRFDRNRFKRLYSRFPLRGEIGCVLSHRKCFEKLLTSDEEVALVLEDDIAFICAENMEKLMGECVHFLKNKNADILLFSQHVCYFPKQEHLTGPYFVYSVYVGYGTFAYLITRQGAERLLCNKRPYVVADNYGWMRKKGLKVKCVFPEVVKECSVEKGLGSQIVEKETSRIDIKPSILVRVWLRIRLTVEYTYLNWMYGRMINHDYW